jgi:hypothetical protein
MDGTQNVRWRLAASHSQDGRACHAACQEGQGLRRPRVAHGLDGWAIRPDSGRAALEHSRFLEAGHAGCEGVTGLASGCRRPRHAPRLPAWKGNGRTRPPAHATETVRPGSRGLENKRLEQAKHGSRIERRGSFAAQPRCSLGHAG